MSPRVPGFLIGFDSDGCVFDNMTVKHRRCFGTAFIDVYGLSAHAELAARLWDFVNLFSTTRGCNRFLGVVKTMRWLARAGIRDLPSVDALDAWSASAPVLGASALEAYAREHPLPEFNQALAWSAEVNRRVKALAATTAIPPVEGVAESFRAASGRATLIVVSQAPSATISEEWTRYGLAPFMDRVCGQEFGSKAEQLLSAGAKDYPADHVLLVGDAPGDYKAAQKTGALFFPIVPGREVESWRRFHDEALPRFLENAYRGNFADGLLAAFEAALPSEPDFL